MKKLGLLQGFSTFFSNFASSIGFCRLTAPNYTNL